MTTSRKKQPFDLVNGLKRARQREGQKRIKRYTQAQLAEDLGCEPQSVKNWEKGASLPHYDALKELCRVFDCGVDYLFMLSDFKRGSVTGLSEGAVQSLSSYAPNIAAILSLVLISPFFTDCLTNVEAAAAAGNEDERDSGILRAHKSFNHVIEHIIAAKKAAPGAGNTGDGQAEIEDCMYNLYLDSIIAQKRGLSNGKEK